MMVVNKVFAGSGRVGKPCRRLGPYLVWGELDEGPTENAMENTQPASPPEQMPEPTSSATPATILTSTNPPNHAEPSSQKKEMLKVGFVFSDYFVVSET